MFQLFLRGRPGDPPRGRADRVFKARSADRDAATDQARVNPILQAIDGALQAAEQEQAGLSHRVEDVLARAAVTQGNGADEYLEREALDSYHQDLFGQEISNGQRRLDQLAVMIDHFRFLKAATMSRFPAATSGPCDSGAPARDAAC